MRAHDGSLHAVWARSWCVLHAAGLPLLPSILCLQAVELSYDLLFCHASVIHPWCRAMATSARGDTTCNEACEDGSGDVVADAVAACLDLLHHQCDVLADISLGHVTGLGYLLRIVEVLATLPAAPPVEPMPAAAAGTWAQAPDASQARAINVAEPWAGIASACIAIVVANEACADVLECCVSVLANCDPRLVQIVVFTTHTEAHDDGSHAAHAPLARPPSASPPSPSTCVPAAVTAISLIQQLSLMAYQAASSTVAAAATPPTTIDDAPDPTGLFVYATMVLQWIADAATAMLHTHPSDLGDGSSTRGAATPLNSAMSAVRLNVAVAVSAAFMQQLDEWLELPARGMPTDVCNDDDAIHTSCDQTQGDVMHAWLACSTSILTLWKATAAATQHVSTAFVSRAVASIDQLAQRMQQQQQQQQRRLH